MPKINWTLAKKDYLEDPTMSYRKLADKYGVAKKTVEQHATVEGWPGTRQRLANVTITNVETEIVDRNSQINEKHNKQYVDMQVLAINIVRMANQTMNKAATAKGIENLSIYEKDFISPRGLKDLYESLKIAMDGERVTVGLPTSVERKEFTGKDGSDLFAKADPDAIYDFVAESIAELARIEADNSSQ